jgi:pimeloyl-ACP methyl ester carboxylesterase
MLTDTSEFVYQTADGMVKNVAPDLPVEEAQILAVTQGRLAGKAFGQSVNEPAWKTKPSWFIVTADDRVVSPDLQAAEAKRMGARTTVLRSSHMSLLSHPSEVAAVIEDVVATTVAKL